MIPRAGQRGHSFKGAGQYFLHDKKAQTKERVMWTETINLPTTDPEKAMGWMAHTAMNADRLKRKAGVSSTGRKKTAGDVYTLSLAWHPKQYPDKDSLLNAALETVEGLDLQEHQAVIVAHQDTAHPHVHIIFNLVHPENGKTRMPSNDWLKLSDWAEGVERNDGEILCEQRVINNQKRKEQGQDNKMKYVKHKEKPLDIAPLINELYQQSDSGKAFQAAVAEKGLTLAKGDSRGFVLVDEQGKIYSLVRQLEGQRTKDLRERLQDIQGLPMAKALKEERQHFDRDNYETERQKKIVDAAIEEEKEKPFQKVKDKKSSGNKQLPDKQKEIPYDDKHLVELDTLREWEQSSDRKRFTLKAQQEVQYGRKKLLKEIKELEAQIAQPGFMDRVVPNKIKSLNEYMKNLKKNLANIDQRIQEQNDALELKIQQEHPDKKKRENENKLRPPSQDPKQENKPNSNNNFDLDR